VAENDLTGAMKVALRGQICSQCRPVPSTADSLQTLAPYSCETDCALFVQLPRLARFLERHRSKPPAGYEEFVLKLLCESGADISKGDAATMPRPFLDYVHEALAILERIVALLDVPAITTPEHDCARRSFALGQLCVHVPTAGRGHSNPGVEEPKRVGEQGDNQ
jgi:hypothetical protein